MSFKSRLHPLDPLTKGRKARTLEGTTRVTGACEFPSGLMSVHLKWNRTWVTSVFFSGWKWFFGSVSCVKLLMKLRKVSVCDLYRLQSNAAGKHDGSGTWSTHTETLERWNICTHQTHFLHFPVGVCTMHWPHTHSYMKTNTVDL